MENITPDTPAEYAAITEGNNQSDRKPSVTLFIAFGIGLSYLFYVEKESLKERRACWQEVFKGEDGWKFGKLQEYKEPLGQTVTLNLAAENDDEAKQSINRLHDIYAKTYSAELKRETLEAVFFTTGVAVLVVRLEPIKGVDSKFYDRFSEEVSKEEHDAVGDLTKFCRKRYINALTKVEREPPTSAKQQWALYRFKEVDREGWEPTERFGHPLFFVDRDFYKRRTRKILKQVAGSREQRRRQSDAAKVSYKGMEIYVDWSEALVNEIGDHQESIENNFIIALASWLALVLMNNNSSVFLFEAFIGMIRNQPRSIAKAIHEKNMAYKDVVDAALPIRWTTRRRDLYLLETIHCNWSSERWRQNIKERMKSLTLHYNRLEDERRQEEDKRRQEEDERRKKFDRKVAVGGLVLTTFVLVSAIADLIELFDDEQAHHFFLGHSVKKDFVFLVVLLALIALGIAVSLWLRSIRRSRPTN